ncbi:uncharacterized protein G2W53_006057 [Senna tora]|uniref:Uncharacterized protein n=1 Tax=Senna tora TaxID=362788 RepID=A0A834X3W7_9FABA|nr:uncharacterized protein G2W53_006057 [Senna tora]
MLFNKNEETRGLAGNRVRSIRFARAASSHFVKLPDLT